MASKYCVISKDSNRWSKDVYGHNYQEAYSYVSKSDTNSNNTNMATIGGIAIVCDYYQSKRWIQWEIIGTYVCLQEIWLDYDLKDSAVCFKFDNENRDTESPIAITISSNRSYNSYQNRFELTAVLCVAMKNGFIYRINLDTTDERVSLLASSVHHNDGQIVDIYRGMSLNFDSNKPPLSIFNSQHKITCGIWKGPNLLVVGLNGGDVLFITIRHDNRIEEALLKDSVGLQALWSGIIGSRNENKEIVTIASDADSAKDGYVLTISSTGSARLWNSSTKQCMCQTELSPLVSDNANDIGRVEKSVAKLMIDNDDDCVHAVVGVDYHTGGQRSWYIMYLTYSIAGQSRATLINVRHSDPNTHPIRPALVDIGIDTTSNNSTSIIAVWRSEDKIVVAINSSSLNADDTNSFTFELIDNSTVDDKYRDILKGQLGQIQSLEERHRVIHTSMIRKIFNSKQFTVATIQAVFQYEIPEDFRINSNSSIDVLIGCVKDKCSEWAARRCDEADEADAISSLDDYNETFVVELENVYFEVLMLCVKRQDRLQSNVFSGNGCLIQSSSSSSSSSITILARRNGEAGILIKAANFDSIDTPPFSNILSVVNDHLRSLGDLQTLYHDLEAFFFNPINFDDDEGNDQWISTCIAEMCDSSRGVAKNLFAFGYSVSRGSDASLKAWLDGFVDNVDITTSIRGVNSIYDFAFSTDSLKSSCSATLVSNIMKYHVIEKREIAIATAVTLTLFAKGMFGPLSHHASALLIEYIRKVKFTIMYTSYLLWMDAIRPCQTNEFIRLVDLQDTCPNSKTSPDSLILNCFHPQSTSWEGLWLSCICSAPIVDGADSQGKSTLSDDFLKFLAPLDVADILLQGGQFSTLEKLSSLMMTYSSSIYPISAKGDSAISRVTDSLYLSRLRTVKSFSTLNSLLLWIQNSSSNNTAINSTTVSEHLHRSVEALIAASSIPINMISLLNEIKSFNDETFTNSPSYDHVHAIEATKQAILSINGPINIVDIILDAQDKVSALTATKYLPGSNIFSWPSVFLLFCKLAHLTDTAELLRRIRILVPPFIAGNVILRATYALVESIDDTMLSFESIEASEGMMNTSVCHHILDQLNTDLQTCWCQIFEIAQDSKYFDEALSAILKLIDIESVSGTTSSGQRKYWQDCLTALVSRVCDVGRFGWLCSLPTITHNKINISELIAEELEALAIASSPFSSTVSEGNGDDFDINIYYECLCAFFIRHRYFREAAAIMYSFVRRIDSSVKLTKHVSTRHVYLQQMRALTVVAHCMSILPSQQAYLLYPLELNKGSSDIFMNSNNSASEVGYLTLPHLYLMLAKVAGSAYVSDATDYGKPQPIIEIDIAVLLREMCNKGYLSQALSIVKLVNTLISTKKISIKSSRIDGSYDKDMESIKLDRSDLDYPIERLARYCCQELASSNSTISDTDELNELQRIRRNLGISSPSSAYSAQALKNQANHIWDMLLDILMKLDHASNNWSMHKRACEAILKSGRQKLPDSIISSYCGFEFNSNEKKRSTLYTGDPYSLLRLLIEYRHFITASDVLCQLLLNLESVTDSRFMHYNIFDNLMVAIQADIDTGHCDSITITDLKQAKLRLERQMKRHFQLMISLEY